MREMSWEFATVWNQSLISKDRELKPRDYCWASELGGSFIDRFYKMKGLAPTNPPNLRSMRKFQAGNIWEYVVYNVLKRAGLIISTQDKIEFQYEGLLRVSGKQDFIAGGIPDLERAEAEIKEQELPESLYNASMEIVKHLRAKDSIELPKIFLEIKSSADIMFGVYERSQRAAANHYLQLFHYVNGNAMGITEGHICYVNKDNCLLLEFPLYKDDAVIQKLYYDDIAQMTYYYNNNEVPPKEEEVLFNEQTLSFKMNYKVEYSNYLTMLYGYERPELFREKHDKNVKSMNRVFKRCVNGDKMTKLNLDVIAEGKKLFPQWDTLVDIAMANKEFFVSEEEEVE